MVISKKDAVASIFRRGAAWLCPGVALTWWVSLIAWDMAIDIAHHDADAV